MRVFDFLDTFGVNTHLNYMDGAYANVGNVVTDLAYVGIGHVRDHTPTPWNPGAGPLAYYTYAAQNGITFDFLVGSGTDIPTELQQADAVEQAVPGSVDAIEGFNEINNWPVTFDGQTGLSAAIAAEQSLYQRVKADATLAAKPVFDLTGAPESSAIGQSLSGLADFANVHFYPQNGMQPAGWLSGSYSGSYGFAAPAVVTEFGYFTIPQSGWYFIGVSEQAQAQGLLNGYLDSVVQGYSRAYAYELLDEKPDPQNQDAGMHFGLFRNDNTPKPAAVALHNLTRIVGDTGAKAASFTPGALAYTISNLPATGNSLLIQAASGRFDLIVWNEAQFWDHTTGKEAVVAPTTITVSLAKRVRQVSYYDPIQSALPFRQASHVNNLLFNVTVQPVVIEIDP